MNRPTVFLPSWALVEPSAKRIARTNAWKTLPLYDADDLLSEAAILYPKIEDRYMHVDEPAHFVSLFNTAFYRKILDLQRARVRRERREQSEDFRFLVQRCAPEDAMRQFFSDMADAPPEFVRLVHRALLGKRRPQRRRMPNGAPERTNAFLCRVAGLSREVDMRSLVSQYLGA